VAWGAGVGGGGCGGGGGGGVEAKKNAGIIITGPPPRKKHEDEKKNYRYIQQDEKNIYTGQKKQREKEETTWTGLSFAMVRNLALMRPTMADNWLSTSLEWCPVEIPICTITILSVSFFSTS
jgi:hypothetical protein